MSKKRAAPLHHLSPSEARERYSAGANVLELDKTPLARVEDKSLMSRDKAVLKTRLYADSFDAKPVLLYLRGGGFTIGSIDTHDALCRDLAQLSGVAVVSLDYRLAPECPFPTAVHDTWDALAWLYLHAEEWGLLPQKLAVAGDSAGGTLAAVAAIEAKERGWPLALQALIYPGVKAEQDTDSHFTYYHQYILNGDDIKWFFDGYASQALRQDWRFAPLNYEQMEGLCPAWIGLAECDPLVDEGIAYADKLRFAGVAVDLQIYRGVTHEFIKMPRILPEARQLRRDMAMALRTAFA